MIPANSRRRAEIAEAERRRGQVADRGAEREGRDHRHPVEELAPGGVDAVDRERLLGAHQVMKTAASTTANSAEETA